MKLLLDTHTIFWSVIEPQSLSASARAAIEAPGSEIFVSVASAWEMAIKVGIGKWPEAEDLVREFEQQTAKPGFRQLDITIEHVRRAGLIASPHRDPFDRLLAAQSIIEGLTTVTADARIGTLGAATLW